MLKEVNYSFYNVINKKKAILFMICFVLTLSLTGCITANNVTWNGKQE